MKTSSILRIVLFGVIYVLILSACSAAPGPEQLPAPTNTAISEAEQIAFSADTPVAAPATPAPVGILLGAEQGWQSAGIFVRQGQELDITASGKWSHALEDPAQPNPYGPNGAGKYQPDLLLPDAPLGALLGRIGENPPFLIGEHATLTAQQSGELWLSMNDNPMYLSDNGGSLEVTIALGPRPQVPTQLLTNAEDGYLLLYPSEYHAVVYENGMCLTLAEAIVLACHVANAFVEIRNAAGRTLEQVADEVAADANPDIPVKRTPLTISGQEAILLDDIYSVDVLRKVVIVRNGQAYILTFIPWNDTREEFPRLEILYNTVINSFTFLPQLGGPGESTEASDPRKAVLSGEHPVLSVDSIRSKSPDGTWTAEVAMTTFSRDIGHYRYELLTVRDYTESFRWTPYERWSESGPGDSRISHFYWSADGRYLYFTDEGAGHPCPIPFVTFVRRVDLEDGSFSEVPLPGLGLALTTISPDGRTLIYQVEDGFFVRDLASDETRIVPFEWDEDYFHAGFYAWSPEGDRLAFVVDQTPCFPYEGSEDSPTGNSIRILDLESGEVQTLTDLDPRGLFITGWPDPGALSLASIEGRYLFLLESNALVPDPAPVAAAVLDDYLNSLALGKTGLGYHTYERAAELYGGEYDTLIEMNPEIDPGDRATLLGNACELNGFRCLRLREVVSDRIELRPDGSYDVQLLVQLTHEYGGLFITGSYAGAGGARPQQTEFPFTVRMHADRTFQVLDLPLYAP